MFKKKESGNIHKYIVYNRNVLDLTQLLYNRTVIGVKLREATESISKMYDGDIAEFLVEAIAVSNETELSSFKERVKTSGGIHDKSHKLANIIFKANAGNLDKLQLLDALSELMEEIRDRMRS